MSKNALYTDLSNYYDLMCVDIDYKAQSDSIRRFHQLFGNSINTHLDLACGTGPHIRHFIDMGYKCSGLDVNQPMLDLAKKRCPQAQFFLHDMSEFTVVEPVGLVSCFLYSIHYNASIKKLKACFESVHQALTSKGVFCFNAVNKELIDNTLSVSHTVNWARSDFAFQSGWYYSGSGEKQLLKIKIEKTDCNETQKFNDEHAMVAVNFDELIAMLVPYFDVQVFEHDYDKIMPLTKNINNVGNAIFVCVKK